LRTTELWPPIAADAQASLHDLRALSRQFVAVGRARIRCDHGLTMGVVGAELAYSHE
jgi:hypothetical protein